ncbi:Phasin protein [Caballeronia temeraria]|uniref:Phasin protein n=1 Tax=Caballeronia temeraria TaxID=1777137 RepID=A0A158DWW9_9BURK|nr:TIGR01841 family phasin [Caballeronia temeraria]SAK98900.1 Phasin protein [Caballeronia temeraria]
MLSLFFRPANSPGATNLQTVGNVARRYMSGVQQLAELNMQTLNTVFAESSTVFKSGSAASPSDWVTSQSTLIAELPEKTAAYTRHFLAIVRATETDILNETRGRATPAGTFEAFLNAISTGADAARGTANAVVDTTSEIARSTVNTVANGTARPSSEVSSLSAKSGGKR